VVLALLGSHLKPWIDSYGYAAVFALVGLESIGIPLPGETALITAALDAAATHPARHLGDRRDRRGGGDHRRRSASPTTSSAAPSRRCADRSISYWRWSRWWS